MSRAYDSKPNIIAAQDKIVAHLGSEGAFETYYARVGNHMSYLNLPNPCQRASAIADMIVAQKPDTRAKIAKLYKPFFEYLRDQYELKSKQQFRRICDPLNP